MDNSRVLDIIGNILDDDANEKITNAIDVIVDDAFDAGEESAMETAVSHEELEKLADLIIEDICAKCPLDADKYYVAETHQTVCDSADWKNRCGVAKLRSLLL